MHSTLLSLHTYLTTFILQRANDNGCSLIIECLQKRTKNGFDCNVVSEHIQQMEYLQF